MGWEKPPHTAGYSTQDEFSLLEKKIGINPKNFSRETEAKLDSVAQKFCEDSGRGESESFRRQVDGTLGVYLSLIGRRADTVHTVSGVSKERGFKDNNPWVFQILLYLQPTILSITDAWQICISIPSKFGLCTFFHKHLSVSQLSCPW